MTSPENIAKNFIPVKSSENLPQMQWQIPTDLFYFHGHFPKNPILPAVAFIDLSLEIRKASTGLRKNWKLNAMKILNPLRPGDRVKLSYQVISAEAWRVEWSLDEALIAALDFEDICESSSASE